MSEHRHTHRYIRVREVMTQPPQKINGLSSVRQAIDQMRDARVSSLIIDRRHEGDEYGMLSVHDIAGEVIAKERSPERVSVYEIMSKPVLTVHADMDVKYAIRLLTRFRLTRGVVVERGEMVGLVTLRDMTIRYTAPKKTDD